MADIIFEEITPYVEGSGDNGKTAREKINRNFDKLKGFDDAVANITELQGRDEPIVFTNSKDMNTFIKTLFVDVSRYNGEAEILNIWASYWTNGTIKYLALWNAQSEGSQIAYIGLSNSGGVISFGNDQGIFVYLEVDELALPEQSIGRTKLTSWATSGSFDPRKTDGGFTESPVLNKYIKKLWIEFPDDYTLPTGYESIDDVKANLCIYSLNHNNVVDDVYKPKFYFRLFGVQGQFIQYDNDDGVLGEIDFKQTFGGGNGVRLHAIIDWENLKGKRFASMYTFLTPICFDEGMYHDSSIREIEERLSPIENYFEGGEFDSFDVVDYTNSFLQGFIVTNVGDDIRNASITNNNIYRHLFLSISESTIQDGYIIEARGRNGSSSKFVSLIKNNIVVSVVAHSSMSDYSVIVDSEAFDTILFNAKTNDEGFYVKRKRQITIERNPLIEDIDNLKQFVEDAGGGGVESKRKIKIVCFGNSFTQDSMSYVPPILKAIAPKLEFTIMLATIGGSPLAKHCANFTGESQTIGSTTYSAESYSSCSLFTSSDSNWRSITTLTTVDSILDYVDWDIITFQQLSGQAYGSWDTYFKPFIYKIHQALHNKISGNNFKTKRIKIGWLLTHGKGETFSSSKRQWEGVVANAKQMLAETATEIIFPYGTAVQNLRTKAEINALGYSGGLSADGTHLQDGIGCLSAAYTNALVILQEAGFKDISVIGDKVGLGIDLNWVENIIHVPSPNLVPGSGNPNNDPKLVVGINSDNCYLAQVCAIDAVKNPFELSFDETGEGLTLDDFLPTNN